MVQRYAVNDYSIDCTDDGEYYLVADIDPILAALEAAVREKDEQITALTESRDEWKWQWRLMEAAERKAEDRIKELENEKLADTSATVIEGQRNEIAALTTENERLREALETFSIFILEECDDWKLAHKAARRAQAALKGEKDAKNGR